MNKTRARRLNLLYDDEQETYTNEDLDILWREYRAGKQYPCIMELCQHIAAYRMTSQEYDSTLEAKEREPKQGSSYWLETVKRPGWFAGREIY